MGIEGIVSDKFILIVREDVTREQYEQIKKDWEQFITVKKPIILIPGEEGNENRMV